MELEELKLAWKNLDRQVALLNDRERRTALRGPLHRFAIYPTFELISGGLFSLCTGSFLYESPHTVGLIASALALHLLGIFTIGFSIWQIAVLARANPANPVVQIQADLANLRTWRVRTTQWWLLSSPLLWIAFLVVGAKGLLGIDISGSAWLEANLAFGVLAIPAIWFIVHRWRDRFAASPVMSHIADSIAGHELIVAIQEADRIADFERN